jgi:hypothetical protein
VKTPSPHGHGSPFPQVRQAPERLAGRFVSIGEAAALALQSLGGKNERYELEALRLRSQVQRDLTSEPERRLAALWPICAHASARRKRRFRAS